MNEERLKSLIEGITVWKRGAQRAPHKPLLLLYALARTLRNGDRFIPYTESMKSSSSSSLISDRPKKISPGIPVLAASKRRHMGTQGHEKCQDNQQR